MARQILVVLTFEAQRSSSHNIQGGPRRCRPTPNSTNGDIRSRISSANSKSSSASQWDRTKPTRASQPSSISAQQWSIPD